ncbi:MAG: hypothetical protein ACRC46_10045 [Thermoguttaceae bacterium]
MLTKLFFVVFCLISTGWTSEEISKTTESSTSGSDISIRFIYGPVGFVRVTEQRCFFPGEFICVSLRMPVELASENLCVFETSCRLVNKTSGDVVSVTDFEYHKVKLFDDKSPFFLQSGCRVPIVIEAGKYEFQVIVNDSLKRIQYKKSEDIVILPENTFGLRNILLSHEIGGTGWISGSNLFSVGAQVQLSLDVGGLSINATNDMSAMFELILTNDKGQTVNFSEMMSDMLPGSLFSARIDPRDVGRTLRVVYRFPLNQSGKYTLKIAVQDINSANKTTVLYELPIVCADNIQE